MSSTASESASTAASRGLDGEPRAANALRIYLHQSQKCQGKPTYDWIIEEARRMGIHGGSAFCATAGFGRHGIIQEQRFIEVAADLPILVEFIVDDADVERLLSSLRANGVRAFCTRTRTRVLLIDDAGA